MPLLIESNKGKQKPNDEERSHGEEELKEDLLVLVHILALQHMLRGGQSSMLLLRPILCPLQMCLQL